MLASLFLGFTTLLIFTIRIADVQNLHYRPIAAVRLILLNDDDIHISAIYRAGQVKPLEFL